MNEFFKNNKLIKAIIQIVDRFNKTLLGKTILRFGEDKAAIFAASLAYYAFFSLFPLLLVIVSGSAIFLSQILTQEQIIDFIKEQLPIFKDLISNNIMRVIELRGTIGIVGLVSLVWSSTGYFYILTKTINMAWRKIKEQHFLVQRLVSFGMIGGIACIVLLTFGTSTFFDVLSHYEIPLWENMKLSDLDFWGTISNVAQFIFSILVFWMLYHLTPNTRVSKKASLAGSMLASIAWYGLNSVFSFLLRAGFLDNELVYGSLGTIVTFLLWIYFSNWIILFGAYFSATVSEDISEKVIKKYLNEKELQS